uniref:Uncharacterized protein n=1 Tax=Plectus sambesii TaxID=2011161 RepID=A0A914VYT3_9BILA
MKTVRHAKLPTTKDSPGVDLHIEGLHMNSTLNLCLIQAICVSPSYCD